MAYVVRRGTPCPRKSPLLLPSHLFVFLFFITRFWLRQVQNAFFDPGAPEPPQEQPHNRQDRSFDASGRTEGAGARETERRAEDEETQLI